MQTVKSVFDIGELCLDNEIVELLAKIRQGDEAAFAELAEKYKTLTESAVFRISRSIGKDGGDGSYGIDDLRQYAAVALYRAAKTYEPDADGKGKEVSFGLYAKICVNNALVSVLRKYKSAERKAERRAKRNENTVSSGQNDPLERLVASESARDLVTKIRGELSKYEEEVFDSYITGKSVREIAERLKAEEKSVSNALYRVKVKIKELLINQ